VLGGYDAGGGVSNFTCHAVSDRRRRMASLKDVFLRRTKKSMALPEEPVSEQTQ
jgi:hypothetical protein